MEVNKEEALRSLAIAQKKRAAQQFEAAMRFAAKSVSLFPTPEGRAMVSLIERDIASGGGADAGAGLSASAGTSGGTRASGVEEHITHAQQRKRPSAPSPAAEKPAEKKRQYTTKQLEVVARIRKCRDHEYYEILAIEKTCTDTDVKKAYKKLALALHPDKNGAPGADEAFKMVSKAFQILSDNDLRGVYDSNPNGDPTQRGGGGGGFPGGGMRGFNGARGNPGFHGGMQGEVSPEDLFNMFFGGGGMGGGGGGFGNGSPFGPRVYTFGGNQFNAGRRARTAAGGTEPQSPFLALLPVALLIFFVLFSLIPTIFSGDHVPDPEFRFKPSTYFDTPRTTWQRNVPYHVNTAEWDKSQVWQSVPENYRQRLDAAMFSSKLRRFERGIEEVHIRQLQAECTNFNIIKQRKIADETGLFGWGADYDKIRKLRAERHPSCERLRSWGVTQQTY